MRTADLLVMARGGRTVHAGYAGRGPWVVFACNGRAVLGANGGRDTPDHVTCLSCRAALESGEIVWEGPT